MLTIKPRDKTAKLNVAISSVNKQWLKKLKQTLSCPINDIVDSIITEARSKEKKGKANGK